MTASPASPAASGRPQVVVIGAGFGGLAAARALLGDAVEVTLLDANNFHTFQPLLYQVATAGLDGENVAYAIRGSVRGRRAAALQRDRADGAGGVASTSPAAPSSSSTANGVPYDTLVLASGAVSNDFGVPGVAEHTLPLKHVDDAVALRIHVLSRFEEAAEDPVARRRRRARHRHLRRRTDRRRDGRRAARAVPQGAGQGLPAAAGARRPHHARRDGRPPAGAVHAEVVGAGAAGAGRPRRRRAPRGQRRRGRAGAGPPGGRRRSCAPARSCGPPASRPRAWPPRSARRSTRGGRLVVEPDLSIPGHPEVFAIGDIAAAPGRRRARRCRRSPSRRSRAASTSPARSCAACRASRPSRSATTTRARWRRSAATTRSPSSPTGGGSADRSAGWRGSGCTSST